MVPEVNGHLSFPYVFGPPTIQKSCAPLWSWPKEQSAIFKKAVVFPFYWSQTPRNFSLETALGRVFYEVWKSKNIFSNLSFINTHLYSVQDALNIARAKNSLAIVGEITYCLDGGSVAPSVLSIKVSIYDPKGKLLWAMSHAGRIENPGTIDWFIIKRKITLPEDGLYYLMSALASDLSKPILVWTHGKKYQKTILKFPKTPSP
ncbi:MAG: hypothetical protein Q9M37_08760 [Desulfonauticus sp.]|nr:hypothetical protein [Desulfonauticus sp.]